MFQRKVVPYKVKNSTVYNFAMLIKVLVDKRGLEFCYKIVVQIFHFHSHIFELKL